MNVVKYETLSTQEILSLCPFSLTICVPDIVSVGHTYPSWCDLLPSE